MERIVKASLFLNATNYVRGQQEAERATNKTRDAAAQASAKLQAQREVMETTGRASIFMGTLVAAGIALAVKRYADFDQAMSNVIATGDDARANQDALRQAALDAGAATVYSATEAANAIEELAKAGVSARDILAGGLDASLDLAAAGNLAVADAAGIAATAMQQFNLRGEDMSHVSDLLAAGAGKAMGDVSDLSQALNQVGLVANQTGLTIEETTAGLSAFASAGLLGSDAGTSFKAMLQRLTPQSREAEALMKELGISAYDAGGNFIGLANFAGVLQEALKDKTVEERNSAMATIFGSDAVRAATVLYAEGADGIRKWTEEVDDSGYASRTAATRLDNLKGDLEALGGAFDTVLIQGGSAANDSLRMMVQILTELVTGYADLPQPIQATVMAVGGVTAAVALSGGVALLAVPKWAAFKTAVEQSGLSMGRTALNAGAAGLAIGGLFAIVGMLAQRQAEARQRAQSYADALRDGADAGEIMVKNLQEVNTGIFGLQDFGSALDGAEELGLSFETVKDAVIGVPEAVAEVDAAVKKAKDSFNQWTGENKDAYNAAVTLEDGVRRESEALSEAEKQAAQAAKATDENTESTQSAAAAYLEAADQASALSDELGQLIDQINEANGVGQDAISANLDYQNALAKVDETIKNARDGVEGYSLTLDENTQQGRDNKQMLVDLARDALDAANKQRELDGNTENYRKTLESSRDALLKRAEDLGYNADQAAAFVDQILSIPSQTDWKVIAQTRLAELALDAVFNKYDGRTVTIRTAIGTAEYNAATDSLVRRAGGGGIYGSGPKGIDSVPILAAPGEHVLTAREVDLMGGQGAVYAFRAALRGRVRGYAGGGEIQPQYASSFSPAISVAAPSLEGMAITGRLDLGDGLVGVIEGHVVSAIKDTAAWTRGGRR